MKSSALPYVAGLLILLLVVAAAWVMGGQGGGFKGLFGPKLSEGTNLPLDVRFSYDAAQLTPGEYDDRAEFPFKLAGQGWFFCGKRLRGAGDWLVKDPAPLLYDYLGSVHNEMFTQWYGLVPDSDPQFEDARIQGNLGLHQRMSYRAGEQTRWPDFFPEAAKQNGRLHIEGWAFFSEQDLFYFYAFSVEQLTPEQRKACVTLLDSLKFGAVLGGEEWVRDPYESVRDQLPPERLEEIEGEGQGNTPPSESSSPETDADSTPEPGR